MKTLSLTGLAAVTALIIGVPAAADAQSWHSGQPLHGQHQHPRASEVPLRSEYRGHHVPRSHGLRGHGVRGHGALGQPARAQAIQPGTHARNYQRFHPHAGHRLGHAPRGHHYRNAGGTVVLVNDNSLQIVAIMGLLAALLH